MTDTSFWQRAQDLFEEARERSADERAELLARACAADSELRTEVLSLLKHHDEAGAEFMRPLSPPPNLSTDLISNEEPTPSEDPDPLIGRDLSGCSVQRVLASGGMGTVYLAEQQQPHRQVAIKLLRAGIASKSALRRFEYESEILARMRHPNIAEVHDAGTHAGLPYFVMEYIADAQTITEYAAAGNMSHRDRLRLFEQVCEAVHYGHQRGVIHRDLKPGNILVDSDGRVRVIDFGVARATDADITLTTLHTGTGELVGTLQYMSPEQCDADPHEIDVRSDVYSLGVVLYELLCGRLPYDVRNLSVASAARVICEHRPPSPSSVTGKRKDGSVVDSRPPRVIRASDLVRGDLERIVLKSLEKARSQRYQSAADLLRDVRHYLNHEPIEARPPTLWTRTLRWVARHPAWATTVTCLAIAAMVFAATWISVQWYGREPYKLLLLDDTGEIVPLKEMNQGKKVVEARLIARSRSELESWVVQEPGCITGGYLINCPPGADSKKLVVLAFSDALAGYPRWGNALVAFDPDLGFENPKWIRRPDGDDQLPVPDYAKDRKYDPDDFAAKILGVYDVFSSPEYPGPEVIAYHAAGLYSQRILRIYNLRGDVLYEVWHDGGIDQCYWLESQRLLVFTGTNGEDSWKDLGYEGIYVAHPRVLFAIRPEATCIKYDFLKTKRGDGPLHPVWYQWFGPPGLFGSNDRPVLIRLDPPASSRRGCAVRISVILPSASHAGICWEIDVDGQEILDTRLPNDNYQQNLDELPEPNVPRVRHWPPPPPPQE